MPPTLFLHLPLLPPPPFFPLFPLILEKFPLPSELPPPPSSLRRGAKIKNIRGASPENLHAHRIPRFGGGGYVGFWGEGEPCQPKPPKFRGRRFTP